MFRRPVFALLILLLATPVLAARPGMTWRDLVQVRKVYSEVLSEDGSWLALEARPDRGDGEVVAHDARGRREWNIERGAAPQLSPDGSWLAVRLQPSFEDRETLEEDDIDKPGAALLRTSDGERWDFERVRSFGFAGDGSWFAVHFEAPAEEAVDDSTATDEPETEPAAAPVIGEDEEEEEEKEREAGTRLVLVHLEDQKRVEVEHVLRWSFDPTGQWIAVVVATEDGQGNGLHAYALGNETRLEVVRAVDGAAVPALAWAEEVPRLAYLFGDEEEPGEVEGVGLYYFDGQNSRPLVSSDKVAEGWEIPSENELRWSADAERVFVGLHRERADEVEEDDGAGDEEEPWDFFDREEILSDRGVDVWHYADPRIKPHEKKTFEERRDHLFRAVAGLDGAGLVLLADEEVPDVAAVDNPRTALGTSAEPYLREMTWDGFYDDLWAIDLASGDRELVARRVQDSRSLSPGGAFVVYFQGGDWHLYSVVDRSTRNLTAALDVSFADEDHDYPRAAPDYGVGGWTSDDGAVFLHDKYDVWRFDTATGQALCLTEGKGRADRRQYRLRDLDSRADGFTADEALLLTGFDELAKNSSLWRAYADHAGAKLLREADKYFEIRARAKEGDRILYSEERYDEFGDLWVTDPDFRKPRRLTDLNPQLDDFDLGSAELVEWNSADGIPLQGILIKPAGYDPDRSYPVLVYFYRFFSQRLHRFNDPSLNHRPSFYVYAGSGYAVFLPDIRFEIGRPGLSATKCLVPGVQRIVDMGVADPEAIALHGHSWSGYQAAQVVTQTNTFACAVAGAPVSNMTSAYGGIRYGSGLSRQFQYEKSQSRLGATLWERRDVYIDNSPLFFADRIETPMLMMSGDEDEAVPWTQGIEMYMAMRRLGKPAVFLQYRGEGHHPKKFANKLDYSIRMKEFVDHFCQGAPAPTWWTEGEAYTEDED